MAEPMEKYGLNAARNLARGALFCGQLCQRLQKAAVIRGGGMAFGLGQQPADFASGGAAIYLGLVAVAADTNLSGFDLGGICPGIPAQNALLRGMAGEQSLDQLCIRCCITRRKAVCSAKFNAVMVQADIVIEHRKDLLNIAMSQKGRIYFKGGFAPNADNARPMPCHDKRLL